MRISKNTKIGIILTAIIFAVVAVLIWIGIYTIPDKVSTRHDYALIVETGVEYEVNPARSGNITKFDTIKVEPQYYVEFEVDGETYKVIGADLYDTYKDHIGDSVEVTIRADYYPYIDKFKKVITIPRVYSE